MHNTGVALKYLCILLLVEYAYNTNSSSTRSSTKLYAFICIQYIHVDLGTSSKVGYILRVLLYAYQPRISP